MIPVLFIAYHFPPAGGAGVQRSDKFVRYLPAHGFRPLVLTADVKPGDRWRPMESLIGDNAMARVEVVRVAEPLSDRQSSWGKRIRRWLPWSTLSSDWWLVSATEAAEPHARRSELIFGTMSPFSTAAVASELSARTGIPWVADLRDPWALDEMQVYPSRTHRRLELKRMESLLATAAGIIMNTPEATAALGKACPRLGKPVITITNGFDADDFAAAPPPRTDRKFRIVHSGYLHTDMGIELRSKRWLYKLLGGMENGLDILTRSHVVLLRAVEQWMRQRPELREDLEIVFAGVVSEQDRAIAASSRVSDLIRFTGYIPHSESVGLIRTADLLFLPMHDLPAGKRARIVPGKTYEYMATGRPILAAVPDGDARDFLKSSGLALLCRPDDATGMIEHLDRIYSAWKNGKAAVTPNWTFIRRFERSRLTEQLAGFFNQILQSGERNGAANLLTASSN